MFVTFEGPEGGGKSTLIRSLATTLVGEVLITREPGAGEVGSAIRDILLHGSALASKAELFLFLADRAQHVEHLIRPALNRGAWVLCDRYGDSTVVYQGYGRGIDTAQLRAWNDFATDGLIPDMTFLLDIEPELGLARIKDKDRLDREPLEFHRRIREGFLAEARRAPQRWITLDATLAPELLLAKARDALAL